MNSVGPADVGHFGEQRRVVHDQSLDCRDVGNALATIRDADVWWAPKYCLIFLVFNCARSLGARMATWDQINFETATCMKTGTEHLNQSQGGMCICRVLGIGAGVSRECFGS